VLAGCFVVGLVVGWALRPAAVWAGTTVPRVGAVQVGVLYLVAAILGWAAWATYVTIHRRRLRLPPHQAVNRLVLAKACALVGATVTGGYLGHALSWVGIGSELGRERIGMSLAAALGGAFTVVAALLLERACRVRPDAEES
jgi:hypothetical protein